MHGMSLVAPPGRYSGAGESIPILPKRTFGAGSARGIIRSLFVRASDDGRRHRDGFSAVLGDQIECFASERAVVTKVGRIREPLLLFNQLVVGVVARHDGNHELRGAGIVRAIECDSPLTWAAGAALPSEAKAQTQFVPSQREVTLPPAEAPHTRSL